MVKFTKKIADQSNNNVNKVFKRIKRTTLFHPFFTHLTWFSDVFSGHKMGTLGRNGLIYLTLNKFSTLKVKNKNTKLI